MKRGLAMGLAIVTASIAYSSVSARSFKNEPASYVAADSVGRDAARVAVRPPSEILATVREMGLAPSSEVLRRGPYYVVYALDKHGVELRVVADALFGNIHLVRPAQPYSPAPDYIRAPRIIHVPQPDDAVRRPASKTQIKPRPRHRTDDPPPPQPQRGVKSAPPTDAVLTPIRPTPKFNTKSEAAEKSGTPQEAHPLPKPAPRGG